MNYNLEPNPPGIGPSRLTVTILDQAGRPINGANLEITGKMPQEDISLRVVKSILTTDGTYQAPFVWSTAGEWVLTVKATLPNQQVAEQAFKITVEEKASLEMEANHGGRDGQPHPERVPNAGAAINILAPADGAIFEAGSDVKVQIETHNFPLGTEGKHWHIYVDDRPGQMIMGNMTDAVLRNLEPGQHQISTYLSIGGHEELAEGSTVTITILDDAEQGVTMKK